jgi:hypothetical protein
MLQILPGSSLHHSLIKMIRTRQIGVALGLSME